MTRKLGAITLLILLAIAESASPRKSQGSPVDVEKRVDAILGRMTLEQKIDLLGGVPDFFTRSFPQLGISSLRMSDGPLGVHDYGPTTAYPAGIALAASWDAELANQVGVMMGKDARARGVNIVLAPGMNIYRAPMCGRNFEYFGEDPYLASRIAVSEIEGIQAQGVIATAKHFVANNQEYDRMNVSSDVDERTLREIYLPAFEAAVKEAKVGAIMDAYNLVNGVHMTQNTYLNNEILKKEWGFNGILMSDWGATHDGVAAANAGLDLEMPLGENMNRKTLLPAIRAGAVAVATVDDKARRILRKAIEFGFFGRDQTDLRIPLYNQQGRALALEEARDSMVLLKNDRGILPLDKNKLRTIAVIGPDAYPAVVGGGGSSLVTPFHATSFLEGVSDYLGAKVKVLYATDSALMSEIIAKSDFVTAPGGTSGLTAEYFNNQALEGKPVLTRIDPRVDFSWGQGDFAAGRPAKHFSARWTGFYIPKTSNDYKFYVSADGGARLYVDDQRIIDDWQQHEETVNTASQQLQAGHAYKVRVEYFQAEGPATVRFGVIATEQTVGRETKALAARVDVVVLCVGLDASSESEGSDRTFQLPGAQDALIRDIAEVNRNVIVVLTAGGNVDMTGWIDRVPALIDAWYPGQEGGRALAQILFGDYSPSGKLPASFERRWEDNATFHSYYPQDGQKHVIYSEGIFLGYRHFDRSKVKPMFPFGYGLSYANFEYSNLKISPRTAENARAVDVSFDIRNTSGRVGAEIAELYVGDSHSSVPRPAKELKGFAKVFLQPDETRKVTLHLDRRSFAYYDVKGERWTVEPGDFSILIGGSSEQLNLKGIFTLAR